MRGQCECHRVWLPPLGHSRATQANTGKHSQACNPIADHIEPSHREPPLLGQPLGLELRRRAVGVVERLHPRGAAPLAVEPPAAADVSRLRRRAAPGDDGGGGGGGGLGWEAAPSGDASELIGPAILSSDFDLLILDSDFVSAAGSPS